MGAAVNALFAHFPSESRSRPCRSRIESGAGPWGLWAHGLECRAEVEYKRA